MKFVAILTSLCAVAAAKPASEFPSADPVTALKPAFEEEKKIVKILRDDRQQDVSGRYAFDFESEDGIIRSESGAVKQGTNGSFAQQGTVQFTYPTGEVYSLKYVADENGFQPESPNLPVAPAFPHEIPEFVLEQIARAKEEDKLKKNEAKSKSFIGVEQISSK